MTKRKRYAMTQSGRKVQIGTMTKVEGGWQGFTMGRNGFAVIVFVPSND